MAVRTDKPTLATLAGSKLRSNNKYKDVIYVTRRLAQGPVGCLFFWFCFVLQYLDNCEGIDIPLPVCRTFSLCCTFHLTGRRKLVKTVRVCSHP